MASGPDNGDPPDKDKCSSDEFLSPRAKKIKREIQEGRYKVDLGSLAQRLMDDGLVDEDDDRAEAARSLPAPQSGEAKNDQKPKGE